MVSAHGNIGAVSSSIADTCTDMTGTEEWKRIIWTDESSVELGKNTRIPRVWRLPGEAYLEKCLVPTFKSGRTSVMVWGCIAYDRKGPLVVLPAGQHSGADYVELVLAGPL
jgi:hypothetical protein